MERMRHLLDAWLLQTFFQNRQSFVERHARLQQMSELLGENEQLTVRDFQILRRRRGSCAIAWCRFGLGPHQIDPDRNTFLQFNLSNGDCSICAIEYALNQGALRVASTICKLWHRRGKLIGNRRSQTRIWLCRVESLKNYKVKKHPFEGCNVLTITSPIGLSVITVIAQKFCLPCCLILLRAADMKCAAVSVLVFIAFVSQTFAVLRPLFPAKPAPPFSGEVLTIGDDSIRYSAGDAPTTAPR
jgi:hypothetical protein